MDTERKRTFAAGQAMVELALGLFAVSLVLAALLAFVFYINASLNMSRDSRAEAGQAAFGATGGGESYSSSTDSETVEVSPIAAKYIFGSSQVEISERVHIPNMKIMPARE